MRQGFRVVLIGRWLPGSPPVPVAYASVRFRLWFRRSAWFYANYNFRLFWHLIVSRYSIVLSNDLDTLPACYLASRLRRTRLVYDSHELFTEVPELVGRPLIQKVWQIFERILLPRIGSGYTVCKSIARYYEAKYGVMMQVVRNVPYKLSVEPGVEILLPLPEPARYILYRGVVNVGRGLECLFEALPLIHHCTLIVAGDGDILQSLQQKVEQAGLKDKVLFIGRQAPSVINALSSRVQLGVSLEEDLGLNYRFALPNKLFDYIQCRVPVLVSDLPEMRAIVEEYGVGEVVADRQPSALANQVMRMLENSSQRELWKANLTRAARELCWENEQTIITEIFGEPKPNPSE